MTYLFKLSCHFFYNLAWQTLEELFDPLPNVTPHTFLPQASIRAVADILLFFKSSLQSCNVNAGRFSSSTIVSQRLFILKFTKIIHV